MHLSDLKAFQKMPKLTDVKTPFYHLIPFKLPQTNQHFSINWSHRLHFPSIKIKKRRKYVSSETLRMSIETFLKNRDRQLFLIPRFCRSVSHLLRLNFCVAIQLTHEYTHWTLFLRYWFLSSEQMSGAEQEGRNKMRWTFNERDTLAHNGTDYPRDQYP